MKLISNINKIKYLLFNEFCLKKLDYDWSKFPSRNEIIQAIINHKSYETYLEIGCDTDYTFKKIVIKRKVGVDPIRGGNIRSTSDDFFKTNKESFDCIFIDGSHLYDQVRKDIINAIKVLNNKGIIFLHDTLPKKIWYQVVPKMDGHWNGDVWKAIVECRTIENIDTYTCIADHGLSIILQQRLLLLMWVLQVPIALA